MTSKKLILTTVLSFLTIFCFSQSTDVLKLQTKKYFDEKNFFFIDTTLKIIQEVGYDEPQTIDESYTITLKLDILDTIKAKTKKNLDLAQDTSLIKCNFDVLSVWNWEVEKTRITGTVSILSWSITRIELDFNTTVLDLRKNRAFIYKGKKTFKKKVN